MKKEKKNENTSELYFEDLEKVEGGQKDEISRPVIPPKSKVNIPKKTKHTSPKDQSIGAPICKQI